MAITGTMEINADPIGGGCLLVVSGEIDLANVNIFIERLFELSVDGDQKIVLDMTDVEFVDSTVLNALFAASPRLRAHGGDIASLDVLYRVVRTRKLAFERLGITPE